MILTVVLICISLTISDNEHLFIYLSEKLWKNVYLSLLPFFLIAFFFDVELMKYLYILGINPSSDISFTNIFFPFNRLSFYFVDASFTVQSF